MTIYMYCQKDFAHYCLVFMGLLGLPADVLVVPQMMTDISDLSGV